MGIKNLQAGHMVGKKSRHFRGNCRRIETIACLAALAYEMLGIPNEIGLPGRWRWYAEVGGYVSLGPKKTAVLACRFACDVITLIWPELQWPLRFLLRKVPDGPVVDISRQFYLAIWRLVGWSQKCKTFDQWWSLVDESVTLADRWSATRNVAQR